MKKHIFILVFLLTFSMKCFSFDNYYKMLGVPENASAEEIKKGYRKMAMKYHPDRNAGSAVAGEIFKKVQGAYDVLSDPQKKTLFDKQLRMQPRAQAKAQPKPAPQKSAQPNNQNAKKHTWSDFGKKPESKPESRPQPKPQAEAKVEPKAQPRPAAETVFSDSKAVKEVQPSVDKPLTETRTPFKNPKLDMYNAPSCSKGFLGTVVDILI